MDVQGMAQCTAKSKRTGEQCRRSATPGREVCYYHGGRTPRGFALPQTKTGRWSKDLPTRLAAHYDASLTDEELLCLRDDISLLDARMHDILTSLGDGDTRKLWEDLHQAWDAYEYAAFEKDTDKAKKALTDIGRIIKRGHAIYASWSEVYGVTDQRRKLVESERKRLVELQAVITVERLMLLITAIAGVVREHVDDRDKLNAIQYGIQRLISTGS
jgi:hypothetical protein